MEGSKLSKINSAPNKGIEHSWFIKKYALHHVA